MISIIVFAVLYLLLLITGTVLNAVLVVVFFRHPDTRTPQSVLLINLCFGDLAYLLSFFLLIPCSLARSDATCIIIIFCRNFVIALNTYSVAAISIQRYIGLVRLKSRLPVTQKEYVHSLLILTGVWILAAVLAAVELLTVNVKLMWFNCTVLYLMGGSLYRLLVYAIIPSVIIAAFYIAAACKVSHSARQLPGEKCNAAFETLRGRRRKSARILCALAVVFICTYLPMLAFLFLVDHVVDPRGTNWVEPVGMLSTLMSTLSPVFNPIALCVASKELGNLYKKYCCCCCCCCCRQQPSASVGSNLELNRVKAANQEREV